MAERDRAGRDNEHVAPLAVQLRNILHERDEPVPAQTPSLAVDQKRGTDLDHDAAEIGKRRAWARHSLNRRRATTNVAAPRFLACAGARTPTRRQQRTET